MADLYDQHLYPLTLAFDKALQDGTVSLDVAGVFVDRVFEAWLEARIRANPALKKEAVYDLALKEEE